MHPLNNILKIFFGLSSLIILSGCSSFFVNNQGQIQGVAPPKIEAEWIRNGEPIEYQGENWYPKDDTETLLDSEMFFLMNYKDVAVFVDKIDVKPYNRLYTKFGYNKFRYFERRKEDDSR